MSASSDSERPVISQSIHTMRSFMRTPYGRSVFTGSPASVWASRGLPPPNPRFGLDGLVLKRRTG
ncbi:hypothetical protein GCM10010220_22170 [Streptomyces parvulus]|nr:hypothetical protein GCM10010220_22170 [Streptomyces parvulus]